MIKLSDYLDYLNNEIIQARKRADENAIAIAKEYAKHEYLKYFTAPRYALPSVKMEIPLKIADIDADEKYNFKMNEDQLVGEINERIRLVNREKRINITEISKKQIQSEDFRSIFKKLESTDQKFGKLPTTEVVKLDLKSTIKTLNTGIFRPQDGTSDTEINELKEIFSSVLLNKYKLVNSKLDQLNKVQEAYLAKSFDFDSRFDAFLHQLLDYFKTKGNTTYESEVLKIMNMIETVKRGFNPVKLETISSGKRNLLYGFSFSGIEMMHGFLTELLAKEHKKLDESEELLSGLMISLYQNNILDDAKIKELNSVIKIGQFWEQLLSQNTSIAGINKKMRLNLLSEDIYLIIEKIITKIT